MRRGLPMRRRDGLLGPGATAFADSPLLPSPRSMDPSYDLDEQRVVVNPYRTTATRFP
jgi:hypothetical protein